MSKENTAYRYRIYPNAAQRLLLAKTFGCCRFIYNRMLSDKIEHYKNTGRMLQTTPASYKEEFPWLKEVDSLALANVQLHLQAAFRRFFSRKEVGFPRFKAKKRDTASYTTNLVNGNIRLSDTHLKLPKMGDIRIRLHRTAPEDWVLKSVTVSMEPSGRYYASILYEYEVCENQADLRPDECRILGIDFAMHGFAVFSDGTRDDYEGYYRKAEARLAREQRRLSRCQKGSKNREKQRKRVARRHEKVRHQRLDHHHKLSRRLADSYDVVVVEDLDLKAMSRGLHLGKGVMDNGYGSFLDILEYKLDRQGKRLVRVDRYFPSSKKCSRCGKVRETLPLSERVYRCSCGCEMDRDVNAAVNIREEGRRILSL